MEGFRSFWQYLEILNHFQGFLAPKVQKSIFHFENFVAIEALKRWKRIANDIIC